MSILKVLVSPNPILRNISEKVPVVDIQIQKIMDDMLETMKKEDGIGLAAVQVGVNKSIIVIDLHHEHHEGCNHHHEDEVPYPLFMVNPEFLEKSEETEIDDEGCLSVPGIYIPVKRSKKIKVKYQDYYGKEQHIETDTFLARVIQHEMDHLNGITMLQYLSPLKRQIAIKKLEKLTKQKK